MATDILRRPIREDLLTENLASLGRVRLVGSRCERCGETSLGKRVTCPQCGQDGVRHIPLGAAGVLWTFTVVRHRPPGNYRGPDPFVPFGLGLVELPERIRVLSPIRCAPEALKIGMPLLFVPDVRVEPDGGEVVAFTFEPADGEADRG